MAERSVGERGPGGGKLLEEDGGGRQGARQGAGGAGGAAAQSDEFGPKRVETAAKLREGLRHVASGAAARIMTCF